MDKLLFLVFLAINVEYSKQTCSIGPGWQRLTMGERLLSANSVVYGKTVQHLASRRMVFGRPSSVIDALFEVYCVIKSGETDIGTIITIEGVTPRDGCSGSKRFMQIGQEAFIALKPTAEGNFEFDEVMPVQSAVFPATHSNFLEISRICGLQSWLPPENATANMCPVCGVANFTSAVVASDDTSGAQPCIINGALVSNGTNCDVILTGSTSTQEICIAENFANTCTQLIYSVQEVICECSYRSNDRGGFMDVGFADKTSSSYPVLFLTIGFAIVFQ